jgi:hypothetical protein
VATRLLAAVVPLVLWGGHVLTVQWVWELGWALELSSGVVVLASLSALVISFLIMPPLPPPPSPRWSEGRRLRRGRSPRITSGVRRTYARKVATGSQRPEVPPAITASIAACERRPASKSASCSVSTLPRRTESTKLPIMR